MLSISTGVLLVAIGTSNGTFPIGTTMETHDPRMRSTTCYVAKVRAPYCIQGATNQGGIPGMNDEYSSGFPINGAAYNELSAHQKYLAARELDKWKELPSVTLAAMFEDIQTVKELVLKRVDVDASALDGVTGLMYAARLGNLELLRLFLDAGAQIEKRDARGASALFIAAEKGQSSAVKFLLDRGANPLLKSPTGYTLLHAAVLGGNFETVQIVLQTGQALNAQLDDGTTPLILAALDRRFRTLQLLVQMGADVNIPRNDGLTALIAATTDDDGFTPGDPESVACLIERGADVNARTVKGDTPLMGAAFYGGIDVVKLLLDHGANTAAKDTQGRSAISLAIQNGNSEIIELLRKSSKL